ncbi:thiol-disulfide oxidoreductase ResA [Sporosarcina ureilytica]|uniref:Thiol-disulfide oxidoreductase n=1 Tax=Sporosarcina ureilytica TaxID=298596 RepID=A0A1D8JHA0_9BACL|nr:thiol-disulfide oxidoreductase ResA [Sporosarcina ureilytica]AOV08097.1 thiol-disulfide oxidoreductase [Sporosarcina ureilytica]
MSKAEQFAKKRKNRLMIRTVVLFLLFGAVIFAIVSKDTEKVLAIGDKAPDFELVDLEGNKHKLSEYEGQGVFLNFWGSWCGPCKTEMPFMERQSKEFEEKGVHILAINIKDTRLKAESFRDQYGLTFPIAQDKDESVRRAYNVIPLPTTILINKDGYIEQIIAGGMDEEQIQEAMESIQP